MNDSPGGARFYCPFCEAEETDITDLVIAERDPSMTVLRTTNRARKWSVLVTCPKGHEVAVDGEFA
jgi:hypothetical protein